MGRHAVITGGTRGLGLALVNVFLSQGYQVTFSGTSPESVKQAFEQLSAAYDRADFLGFSCNVERVHDIKALYMHARKQFGPVDIWINNAAVYQESVPVTQFSDRQIMNIFRINLHGPINVCRIVQPLMAAEGHGAIYNMEGYGCNGRVSRNRTIYGTSKRALRYFTRSFVHETRESPVVIGMINPGLSMTDMLKQALPSDNPNGNPCPWIYRILAYPPESVASYIVRKIERNTRSGKRITWLRPGRTLLSFLTFRSRKAALEAWLGEP